MTRAAPFGRDVRRAWLRLARTETIGPVSLEGRLSATVVRWPDALIFEMRPVIPPRYGPTGGGTCSHCPSVEVVPPVPPSAT